MTKTATMIREVAKDIHKLVNRYSRFHQSVLTIEKFTDFGKAAASSPLPGPGPQSFHFLRHEVPIRLAHIMQEINHLPQNMRTTPSVELVNSWYIQSFRDMMEFQQNDECCDQTLDHFTQALYNIKRRHDFVVETMAQGIREFRETEGLDTADDYAPTVQYFLDRFYMNRVSIRMLITQHLALHEDSLTNVDSLTHGSKSKYIGLFHPGLVVKSVVADAIENASMLCEHFYEAAPEVNIRELNATTPGDPIIFAYVPSHLYHILFELLKNAMRATAENSTDLHSTPLPAVNVDIAKGKEDLTIRISDQGGGIAHSKIDRLFHYHYTTATTPPSSPGSLSSLAGYGYGLPLSRIYTKYFGGDLQISSMEGHGTQANIYLKVLSAEAQEVLPMYNKSVEKNYQKEGVLREGSKGPLRDWSCDSFYRGRSYSYSRPSSTSSKNGNRETTYS